ncbi:hypothetical protein WA171_004661 [Blastocystis sp. BT1]
MPSYRSRHDSRSRSRSGSRHHRSKSRSHSRERSRRSRPSNRKPRLVRDEFGREVREDEYRRRSREDVKREDKYRPSSRESETPKEPEPKIETKEEPVVASTGDFDLEEGEDISANMRQLMGFGSFGSTKGKHVDDNDSVVNQGAARIVKQYKAMRILNRKAKIKWGVC